MSETSLLTGLPRVQNPCLSQGFLQLSLCPSTRRGMQTLWQEAERSRGNTVESTGSRIFFNSMRDELREVCCLPSARLLLVTHTTLGNTMGCNCEASRRADITKGLFNLWAAGWHFERSYLTPPGWSQAQSSHWEHIFPWKKAANGKDPLCWGVAAIATPSFGRGGCSSLQLSWVAARGSRRRCFIPAPSLLWVPDLHKRTDAKFSVFLVFTSCLFKLKYSNS